MARFHNPPTGLVAAFSFPLAIPFFFSGANERTISMHFHDGPLPAVAPIETKVFFFRPRPGLLDDLVLQQRRQLGAIRDVCPGDE
jgi:hypothetical protein